MTAPRLDRRLLLAIAVVLVAAVWLPLLSPAIGIAAALVLLPGRRWAQVGVVGASVLVPLAAWAVVSLPASTASLSVVS